MPYPWAVEINSEERNESGRAVVDAAEALIRETVKRLSRRCPPDLLGEAAREDLLEMKPHIQGALEVLEDTKRRRSLTHKELAQQHAFKMLLAVRG